MTMAVIKWARHTGVHHSLPFHERFEETAEMERPVVADRRDWAGEAHLRARSAPGLSDRAPVAFAAGREHFSITR